MNPTRSRQWLGIAETILILLGSATYLVMPKGFGNDGLIRLQTTKELLGGHISSDRYAILQSALAAPLYLAGEAFGSPEAAVLLFNTAVLLAGLGGMALLLRDRVSGPLIRRVVLIVLMASMFGNHAQDFFGEVLTAVLVAVGLLCLILEKPVAGHVLLILGVVNTPATVPALILALLNRARLPHRIWKALWPAALCIALVMLEFYIRRGDPFGTGYENDHGPTSVLPYSGLPGFSYPFALGALSILFSFGKGLALFVPGLWLLFMRPSVPAPEVLQRFLRYSVWFVIGLVLVYAKWRAWYGGLFWGPRFFLFACFPASIALAIHLGDHGATLKAKALTLAVLAWSLWVGYAGIVIGQWWGIEACMAEDGRFEFLCWYTPEFSALLRPLALPPPFSKRAAVAAIYYVALAFVLMAPFAIDLIRAGRAALGRRFGAAVA